MSNQITRTIQEIANTCKTLEQLNVQCATLTLIAENEDTPIEVKESIQQLTERHKDIIGRFNVSFDREVATELSSVIGDAIQITQQVEREVWID